MQNKQLCRSHAKECIKNPQNQSKEDILQYQAQEILFEEDTPTLLEKIDGFTKYASKQSIAKFLTKYEIFKKILHINGSIIECGVYNGAGLLAWAKLSSIFEPVNHLRKIIGFDTFEGFPSISDNDSMTGTFHDLKKGGVSGCTYENIYKAIEAYDVNRPLNHIQKIELVKGDIAI